MIVEKHLKKWKRKSCSQKCHYHWNYQNIDRRTLCQFGIPCYIFVISITGRALRKHFS